jgi:hypothetical protein
VRPSGTSAAQAAAALAFLVEQHMVVVENKLRVAIHPRFADVLNPPLARVDANESQVSAV